MELSQSQIKTIINEIESGENQERKRKAMVSYEVDGGNLKPYVKARVTEMYPQTWSAYTIADYSLEKKVVDKKAKAYKEAPVRRLSTEEQTFVYQDIVAQFNLNGSMRSLDRLYNQHKYAMMACFMELKGDEKEFKFIPLAPYEFDCIKDDSGNLEVVVLSYPTNSISIGSESDGMDAFIAGPKMDEGKQTKLYAFWTDTNHYMIKVTKVDQSNSAIEFMPIENNPGNINPWGILPFQYAPKNDTPNYPIASPLSDQTIELNALLSVYLTSGNMQIGQLVLKYPEDQKLQMVTQGMMTGLKLPQSNNPDSPATEASYISPQPNMDGHRTSIMTFLNMIMDEQGLSGTQALDGNVQSFTSGLDRMISQSDVQDIIETNQEEYFRFENGLYKIVKAQLESVNDNSLSDEAIRIIYRKPKMMISDTDRLNNLEKALDLGLLEEWEKFIVYDPNITEEEAKEKLARMRASENQRMKDAAAAIGPIDETGSNGAGGGATPRGFKSGSKLEVDDNPRIDG